MLRLFDSFVTWRQMRSLAPSSSSRRTHGLSARTGPNNILRTQMMMAWIDPSQSCFVLALSIHENSAAVKLSSATKYKANWIPNASARKPPITGEIAERV